jgi:hypothetical protein
VIGALKLIVACGFFIKLKSCNKRGMDIRIQTGKILTFQDNVDKENLNGLYNELTNSINENITKDNINASVKKLYDNLHL